MGNIFNLSNELIITTLGLMLYFGNWLLDYLLYKNGARNSGIYTILKEKEPDSSFGIASATHFIVFTICVYFVWGFFAGKLPAISWITFLGLIAIFYVALVIIMNQYTKYILPKYFPNKKWHYMWKEELTKAKEKQTGKKL
jgi:hypothetical protein